MLTHLGGVVLEDLRVGPGTSEVLVQLPSKGAVVGLKRLDDGACPWGLLTSGMSNQASRQ